MHPIVEEPVVGQTVEAEYKLVTSNQAAEEEEYSKSASELIEVFPQRIVPILELDDLWYTCIEYKRHHSAVALRTWRCLRNLYRSR
jgi:hypothetical protein